MSEETTLATIEKVARILSPKFRFGPHEIEDMRQYARLFAIEGIDKYDASLGSLETFLWTHVHNRLCNFKRDNFERLDKPCLHCPFEAYVPAQDTCTKFENKLDCKLYSRWYNRNYTKRNIVNPIDLDEVHDELERNMRTETNIEDMIDYKHIVETLDQHIPMVLRALWIKLKNGISLNKTDREKLIPVIHKILAKEGVDVTKKR